MENSNPNYGPPLDQLLTFGAGKSSLPENWPNYLELGFGLEHVPDLIRMAGDEELNWADSESLEGGLGTSARLAYPGTTTRRRGN